MWHELYRNVGDVREGAYWFDPDTMEIVEVIDMYSAAGLEGVTMIERGGLYVTPKRIERGAEGLFGEKRDPRRWNPRGESELATRVDDLLRAWKDFEARDEVTDDVLRAADVVFRHYGFEDSDSRQFVVNQESPHRSGPGRAELESQAYAKSRIVVSRDPEDAVWRILEDMGIERSAS